MAARNPLDAYSEFDPKVIECYKNLQDLTYANGALSEKYKLLIAMAIDVEHGALQGAIAIGGRALKMGATKEEIVEALRVAYQIGGNRALFTSAQVLQALFKKEPSSLQEQL
jgi:alkylhydroperoxidase/carboxymuconolactone decarboxylase family protein YurZ